MQITQFIIKYILSYRCDLKNLNIMVFLIAKLDCENNDNARPVRIVWENPSSNQRVDIPSEKAKYSNVVHQNTSTQCNIREWKWKWKWTAISLDSFEKLKMADKEVSLVGTVPAGGKSHGRQLWTTQ